MADKWDHIFAQFLILSKISQADQDTLIQLAKQAYDSDNDKHLKNVTGVAIYFKVCLSAASTNTL